MSKQGTITTENAKLANDSLSALFDAIPKSKRLGYIGEFNEAGLFLEAALRAGALLDSCRNYFLECSGAGEQSPFVIEIDKLVPREEKTLDTDEKKD